ncbi:MAG: nucleic acid binding OB-fold tRNA/helicase-type, partial [Herbinix sp.]|nr:nucleic acid binding OB-fold tRNA/helicase-type [Herbinix sp.]
MRKMVKRYLAVILSIIMAFSVTPMNSFADATADTYVKINTIDEFTTGKYVMIVNSGYAVGQYDSTKWLLSTALSPENGQVVNPNGSLTWNITVSGSAVTLIDANRITVKPYGKNENWIVPGAYEWEYNFINGEFYFKGTGEDAVTLASNKNYDNKFRGYKNTTVANDGKNYLSAFSLYKLNSNSPPGSVKTETPTSNMPSGSVVSGSAISLSCSTPGSNIRITTVTPPAIWVDYTQPIVITSNTTIYAQAIAPGYEDSDIAEFNYLPILSPGTGPTLYDPIATIPDGSKSVLEACQTVTGQSISVVGQLVYRFGSYNTVNTAILEDVIDGQIYALQVYDALSTFKIGDVVKLVGTTSIYGGVPQLQKLTARELVTSAADLPLIKAQEYTSFSELKAFKDSLLSEWVVIKGVTLGTYNSNGSTTVTDSSGSNMPIYSAATYPSGVAAGEKVDLYACLSKYTDAKSTTDQLRVGSSSDYVVTSDTKSPTVTMPSTFDSAELGKDYKVSVTITDNVAVTEAELTYTVNQVPTKISMSQSSSASTTWEGIIPGSVLDTSVTGITVFVTAKDKAGNSSISDVKEISVVDEPQVIGVTPERNGKTGEDKRPLISVSAVNLGLVPTAKLTLKAGGTVKISAVAMTYSNGTFSYTPAEDLADTKYTASVVITRADEKSITYEWPFTVGTPKYSLYFGQLHS